MIVDGFREIWCHLLVKHRRPRSDARRIELNRSERRTLKAVLADSAPARVKKRARVLLCLDEGVPPSDIPKRGDVGYATVKQIRLRYERGGLERALYDRPRPGPKRRLDQAQVDAILALVRGSPPKEHPRWTVRLLTREIIRRGIADKIGRETVRLLLHEHEQAPWRSPGASS